jgi:hypothetical protein
MGAYRNRKRLESQRCWKEKNGVDTFAETNDMKLNRLMLAVLLELPMTLAAQTEAPSPMGKYERVKVHGKSLEGNLSGDSADRDVSIYLPPSPTIAGSGCAGSILSMYPWPSIRRLHQAFLR